MEEEVKAAELGNMTSKQLAGELCREEIYTHSISEEQAKKWDNKIPSLAKAMRSLNGKTTKSYMLNNSDIVADVLEEWYETRKYKEVMSRLFRLIKESKPTPEELALNQKEAAAPDMYEALKEVHKLYFYPEEMDFTESAAKWSLVMNKVVEALLKAEGKTQNS